MVDVPRTGTALDRYITIREIIYFLTIDAINQISVLVGEIPSLASSYAVIAVIEEVNFIAVKDRTIVAVDILLSK